MNLKLGTTFSKLVGTFSPTTGAATNADSTPTVTVYEDGVSLAYAPTVTNRATGLYEVDIVATAGNGFEVGKRYTAAVVATVGGITGRIGLAAFLVMARSDDDLAFPATTGRALNVSAGGVADADVKLWLAVAPNALVSGRVDASAGAVAAGAITAAAIATDAIDGDAIAATAVTEIQAGLATAANQATIIANQAVIVGHVDTVEAGIAAVQADTDNIQTRLPAALVSGRIDASVGAMAAGVVTAAAVATDAIDADAIAASAVTEIQAGLALSTQVDTVEATLATNLDVAVSTRAPAADTTSILGRLPAALVGGRMDASVGAVAANAITAAGLAADVGTEIAAAVWSYAYEGAQTVQAFLRLARARLWGKGTVPADDGTYRYRDLADTKDRIVAAKTGTARTISTEDGA